MKVKVISEIGINHNGQYEEAKTILLKEAAKDKTLKAEKEAAAKKERREKLKKELETTEEDYSEEAFDRYSY